MKNRHRPLPLLSLRVQTMCSGAQRVHKHEPDGFSVHYFTVSRSVLSSEQLAPSSLCPTKRSAGMRLLQRTLRQRFLSLRLERAACISGRTSLGSSDRSASHGRNRTTVGLGFADFQSEAPLHGDGLNTRRISSRRNPMLRPKFGRELTNL
jgi:hypothetical protein